MASLLQEVVSLGSRSRCATPICDSPVGTPGHAWQLVAETDDHVRPRSRCGNQEVLGADDDVQPRVDFLDPDFWCTRPTSECRATRSSRRRSMLGPATGRPKYSFPDGYVHGLLHHPPDDTSVPNLPPRMGTAFERRPPRLFPDSAVPPKFSEPLASCSDDRGDHLLEAKLTRGDGSGIINRVVYDCWIPPTNDRRPPNNCNRSLGRAGPLSSSPCYYEDMQPWYIPEDSDDDTLVFESRFETGNLRRVVQVAANEYDLILQPDINTKRHTQWFFFAIMNVKKKASYKFNIINLAKRDSLYTNGQQPLVHSHRLHQSAGMGWYRAGSSIAYFQNGIRHKGRRYYTLSFTLTCHHGSDLIHVAHCYPYTYTDLQQQLWWMTQEAEARSAVHRRSLCTTLSGNVCDVLTITAPGADPVEYSQRKGVVISARVHPGETNASWMMKGVVDLLAGGTEVAQELRRSFVFKLIPMLNPDGVINGNYRCNLACADLNRVWEDPDPNLYPTIHHYFDMIRKFQEEREVVLMCDLHGHSREMDVFMYGCELKGKDLEGGGDTSGRQGPGMRGGLPGVPSRFQDKLFPLLLHYNTPGIFSFPASVFKVQRSKAGTGRVVGFKTLGLVNSFTLEASFCGSTTGAFAGLHFNTSHLEMMGAALVGTLLDYWNPDRTRVDQLLEELAGVYAGTEASGENEDSTASGGNTECSDSGDETSEADDTAGNSEAASPGGEPMPPAPQDQETMQSTRQVGTWIEADAVGQPHSSGRNLDQSTERLASKSPVQPLSPRSQPAPARGQTMADNVASNGDGNTVKQQGCSMDPYKAFAYGMSPNLATFLRKLGVHDPVAYDEGRPVTVEPGELRQQETARRAEIPLQSLPAVMEPHPPVPLEDVQVPLTRSTMGCKKTSDQLEGEKAGLAVAVAEEGASSAKELNAKSSPCGSLERLGQADSRVAPGDSRDGMMKREKPLGRVKHGKKDSKHGRKKLAGSYGSADILLAQRTRADEALAATLSQGVKSPLEGDRKGLHVLEGEAGRTYIFDPTRYATLLQVERHNTGGFLANSEVTTARGRSSPTNMFPSANSQPEHPHRPSTPLINNIISSSPLLQTKTSSSGSTTTALSPTKMQPRTSVVRFSNLS